jgi:hypothetical protein
MRSSESHPRSLEVANQFNRDGSLQLLCRWAIQARSTRHTKPFLPSTPVSYPCRPMTRTVASREMSSGAAVRARAISASRSIMYWSSGAMLRYLSLSSCACVCPEPAQTTVKLEIKPATALLGVHRFLPTRSILSSLEFAARTKATGTNQGRTLPCRSRIAQGI